MKKIRNKLAAVILLVLLFNMVATMTFGQTLLERFYLFNKNKELASFQEQIKDSYLTENESITEQISNAEKKNITILIFSIKDDVIKIEYFSRAINETESQSIYMPNWGKVRYNPLMWINDAIKKEVIVRLDEQTVPKNIFSNNEDDMMRDGPRNGNMSMQIYSKISAGVYMFMETPREFIAQTANSAVRYMFYISLFTLFLALILVAFVSKKITKPISNIENVANKIAGLDFSEKCHIETDDEIGQLGKSINRMSETLQESINKLTIMNFALKEDLDREEKTNRMRREFIANVSHDFKTPLSLISAYGEAIRDGATSLSAEEKEEMKRQCDIIIEESAKIDTLVNQLLKLSLLESKTISLNKSMFDLTGIVEETVYKHQIILKDRNIKVDFTNRTERLAYGDYSKIGQVFGNLLDNAIKYSKDGGTIKIWITAEEKFVVNIYNEVSDTSTIDTNQLFSSFYKQDNSRSLEDKSYGLGLAIVKAIIDLHENKCGVVKEDNGMTFWFEVDINK